MLLDDPRADAIARRGPRHEHDAPVGCARHAVTSGGEALGIDASPEKGELATTVFHRGEHGAQVACLIDLGQLEVVHGQPAEEIEQRDAGMVGGENDALRDHVATEERRLIDSELPSEAIEARPIWADEGMRHEVGYWRTRYASGVRAFDRRLAPYLKYLRDSGILDQSYVIVTSYHGEELFENGGW